MWIDTHCHLDAPEFDADRAAVVQRARAAGVARMVLPAVRAADFDALRQLADTVDGAYALGIHPLHVDPADETDLERLREALHAHRDDPRLVAVGEIGLDHFVPGLDRERQQAFYVAQLKIARDAGLPVILHVRRSADALLHGLRRIDVAGGIAHAFNGSEVQARQFVDRGFALGFGGAMSFDRALRIRALATSLPSAALRYSHCGGISGASVSSTSAADRGAGAASRNEPAELPRIGAVLAGLRGWTLDETARISAANAATALPRLAALPAAAGA